MIRNLKKEFNALYQGYLDHEGEDPGLTSFLLTESESMATQRAREEAEMQRMSNRKKILEEALQYVALPHLMHHRNA